MKNQLIQTLLFCVIDLLFQLESAGENQVNDDFAVSLMESVGAELQSLDEAAITELISIINKQAAEEDDVSRREYLESFAENFGIAV